MTEPAVPATGPGAEIEISMFLFQRGDHWMFGHGGANEGFRCNAMASRDGGFGVVVMTNSDNGSALAEEIERALFAKTGWPSQDPIERAAVDDELRKQLLGRYTMGPGNPFEIAAYQKSLALLDADGSIPAEMKQARRVQSQEMLNRLLKSGD